MAITLQDALAELQAAELQDLARNIRLREEGERLVKALTERCRTSGDECKSQGFNFDLLGNRFEIRRNGNLVAWWHGSTGSLELFSGAEDGLQYSTTDVDDAVRKTAAVVRSVAASERGRKAA